MKSRTVVWKSVEYEGIEYLTLNQDENQIEVESVVISLENPTPFRLDYGTTCDTNYGVRELNLTLSGHRELQLKSDGEGNWYDSDNRLLADLQSCLDLDISATPFTNTLPIKRIRWQPGQAETLNMVYILIPDLTIRVDSQRYTCVEKTASGGIFRFESLSTGFTALLPVDADGLVLDYPGLFNRLWPRP